MSLDHLYNLDFELPRTIAGIPRVSYHARKSLPMASGVYFVMQERSLLYIGSSVNIRQRCASHPIYKRIADKASVQIGWLHSSPSVLLRYEQACIDEYKPSMNRGLAAVRHAFTGLGLDSIQKSVQRNWRREMKRKGYRLHPTFETQMRHPDISGAERVAAHVLSLLSDPYRRAVKGPLWEILGNEYRECFGRRDRAGESGRGAQLNCDHEPLRARAGK